MEIKDLEEGEVFPELPKTLTCLTIESCTGIKTLPLTLPPVSILSLRNLNLKSLANIPNSVQILHLIDCRIDVIQTFPLTLETLHVQNTTVNSFLFHNTRGFALKSLILNNCSPHFLVLTVCPYLTNLQIHTMSLKSQKQFRLEKNSSFTDLQLDTTDIEELTITDIAPNLQTLLLLNTPIQKLDGFPMTLQQCICRGTKLLRNDCKLPSFLPSNRLTIE